MTAPTNPSIDPPTLNFIAAPVSITTVWVADALAEEEVLDEVLLAKVEDDWLLELDFVLEEPVEEPVFELVVELEAVVDDEPVLEEAAEDEVVEDGAADETVLLELMVNS